MQFYSNKTDENKINSEKQRAILRRITIRNHTE